MISIKDRIIKIVTGTTNDGSFVIQYLSRLLVGVTDIGCKTMMTLVELLINYRVFYNAQYNVLQ